MKRKNQFADAASGRMRVERAEARTERAEMRTAQARTRAEMAETRAEQAETRTEQAKTRTEQAEVRTELAETTLEREVQKEVDLRGQIPLHLLKRLPFDSLTDQDSRLDQLTSRQREILQLIAQGQNTKQIAGILKVSPKTIEYHRMKLMAGLNLHDIPGLVRFALRVGLLPLEA